jgi:hypothetical protein
MSIQGGIAKIRLVAVLTLKIAAIDIVLGPSLVFVLYVSRSTAVII